jgi:membrane-associated phospholipid phosphatase
VASIAVAVSSQSLALDLEVYATLQAHSRNALHHLAFRLDGTARVVLGLIIAGALAADGRRWLEACVAALRVASGAFVGELLKTLFERLRPSALPGMTTGNSLPSGHVMNTTLVAVAAWELADALPRRWIGPARAAAVLAVVAQAGARVAHGSHWPSDVLPSVLLGILWMRAAEPLWSVKRRRLPAVAAGALAYVACLALPALRIHLTSAIDRPRIAVAVWRDGTALVTTAAAGSPESRSWSTTLHGSGVVPDAVELVLKTRCRGVGERCRHVRLSVDDSRSFDLALRCGWHWYYAQPADTPLHAGDNEVVLRTAPGCPRPEFALQSLALVVEHRFDSEAGHTLTVVGPPA